MKEWYYWRYMLRSRSGLNARSTRCGHEGALLRSGDGYACLHPWPELDDLALDRQLDLLLRGGTSPLIRAALDCLDWDESARQRDHRTDQSHVPRSHWLWQDGDEADTAKKKGFDTVKIKGNRDGSDIVLVMREWAGAGFHLRLDFNESLSQEEFRVFWESLDDDLRGRIEWVEDPCQWSESGWEQLRTMGVPVAADRAGEQRRRGCDALVVKPALAQRPPGGGVPYYVTSYMDHPLGQVYAAAKAAEWARTFSDSPMLTCGLLTHHCFEPDAFSERLHQENTVLSWPDEPGLGFTDLLESLPWKRLT